jgi:transmembrane protein TMEM174 (potassium channel)
MPANLPPARRRDDLPSLARLLTLSDNVVAIALTLLVFQLKVPATALVRDRTRPPTWPRWPAFVWGDRGLPARPRNQPSCHCA